jgi:hypothetical protein
LGEKKNPGHYSGVFKTNTFKLTTLLKFSVEPLRPTENKIPDGGISSCNQLWVQTGDTAKRERIPRKNLRWVNLEAPPHPAFGHPLRLVMEKRGQGDGVAAWSQIQKSFNFAIEAGQRFFDFLEGVYCFLRW